MASFSVFPMQSAPNGDSVSYMGFPFSPDEGATVDNSYISRRTATGWQTTAMSPRRLENNSNLAYSESLGQAAIATNVGVPLAEGAPSGYQNIYLQNSEDPAALQPVLTEALLEALAPSGRPYRGTALKLAYAGHSTDFAAQYFAANDSLTFATPYAPEPPELNQVEFDLYESRGGQLALVNVLPDHEVAEGASFASGSPDTHGISDRRRQGLLGSRREAVCARRGQAHARSRGPRPLPLRNARRIARPALRRLPL